MDQLRHVVETGTEVTEEVRLRDGEGRIRWGHMRIVPEFAPDGKVASVLAINRDIDELKRSEQLFRTLTENFPDFIARFDSEGRHLYVNPAIARAFGLPQEAFIGKTPRELAPTTRTRTSVSRRLSGVRLWRGNRTRMKRVGKPSRVHASSRCGTFRKRTPKARSSACWALRTTSPG
jgi:PAS domain S-box-containing protein